MSSRNVHTWITRTEEGEKRELRAEKFGGQWRLQSKLSSEERWTYYDSPSLEDLADLRELLWRKYQRRKLAFEDLTAVERLIAERGGTLDPLD